MKKGVIVYAFPSSGKTTLCKNHDNMIDLESSDFRWLLTDEQKKLSVEERKGLPRVENPSWPQNYFDAIEKAMLKYNFVFTANIGSEYAAEKEHEFWLFYPALSQKQEYISRMEERGNAPAFVKLISDNSLIKSKSRNIKSDFVEITAGFLCFISVFNISGINSYSFSIGW